MQVGPYHPTLLRGSGVWSLRILQPSEYIFVRVSALTFVVHVPPDPHDFLHAVATMVATFLDQLGELLELREVAPLLGREEPKPLKERNHVLDDGHEIVHLVVPNPIVSLPHRPALEVTLELRQDHRIAMRDVEAERDLPRSPVVVPRTERNIEAPFAVGEPCKVVTDIRRDLVDLEHGSEPFLLITRTFRFFTAADVAPSTGGCTGLPSK